MKTNVDISGLRRIRIFDSTLRDGEQAPGNALAPEQKLELALAMESLGVDTVETGFPSSSPSDYTATRMISQALTTAGFATLSRANREDIRIAVEAGGVDRHQVQIIGTASDIHLEHKRGMTRQEGIDEVTDALRYARSLGITDLTVGLEDCTRGTDDLLRPLVEAISEAGVTTISVADTVGCMVPAEYGELVGRIKSWSPEHVVISTHCHHDLGLSLANALAGIEAGADEVQATLAGIGERAGNTPLEELAAVLTVKGARLGVTTTMRTEGLFRAYQLLAGFIGLERARNKAIFGVNAFATQAGIHQAGMLRNPVTYEYVEPARFGRERAILVGRHSGRTVIRYLFDQLGVEVDPEVLEELYQKYIADRSSGECLELDELSRLLSARLGLDSRALVGAGA